MTTQLQQGASMWTLHHLQTGVCASTRHHTHRFCLDSMPTTHHRPHPSTQPKTTCAGGWAPQTPPAPSPYASPSTPTAQQPTQQGSRRPRCSTHGRAPLRRLRCHRQHPVLHPRLQCCDAVGTRQSSGGGLGVQQRAPAVCPLTSQRGKSSLQPYQPPPVVTQQRGRAC